MTKLESFWLDLIDGRKYHIQMLYGTEAMQRYKPHYKEREYFINNSGHLCNDADVMEYNRRFFEYCDDRYAEQKAKYQQRLVNNKRKYEATSAYKQMQSEREELVAYIRGITVRDASKEETNPRTTQKESR